MPGVDSGVSRAESKVVGGRAMEEGAGPREDDMLGWTKRSLLAEASSDGDLLWCCTVSAVLPRAGRWGVGGRARELAPLTSSDRRRRERTDRATHPESTRLNFLRLHRDNERMIDSEGAMITLFALG